MDEFVERAHRASSGRRDDARRYFERLLEIYTHFPEGHAEMMDDARAQLARLSGLREPGS